jgi:hypothetical protein
VAIAPHLLRGCDQDPHLSWERIERGFEASEKNYGVSLVNLNRIAFLAVSYGKLDAEVADKALAGIGEQWDEETWGTEKDFESAKLWAARWAPIQSREHASEAAAKANLRTPEGSRYQSKFKQKLGELVEQCALTEGASAGTLEVLTRVGANGTVDEVTISGPGGVCVYQKMCELQLEKTRFFPPPPQLPYWVELDLDWGEFAPVAAK